MSRLPATDARIRILTERSSSLGIVDADVPMVSTSRNRLPLRDLTVLNGPRRQQISLQAFLRLTPQDLSA